MYWPIKQCLKIRIEIRVIWQCLSLSFEETWEINIAKKEFSNTVLWVWMVLAWFCRKNEDLASSCLLGYFFRTVYISHWYMRVRRVKIKVFNFRAETELKIPTIKKSQILFNSFFPQSFYYQKSYIMISINFMIIYLNFCSIKSA